MKFRPLPDGVIDKIVEQSIKIGRPLTHEAARALTAEAHAVPVNVRQQLRANNQRPEEKDRP